MKKIALLCSLIGVLYSCKNDDNNTETPNTDLIGNWRLIETLIDPGDGSGTFTAVESDKIITFHEDGKITSNGSLCDVSIETNTPTSGTYSKTDATFNSKDCHNGDHTYNFKHEGLTLIVEFPCFEPCKEKYTK
ncbi:lipocalin family protein [Aquimarina sp. 2201CG1-2-11]|uniref:lipocalin family protein n=1 Tax=Aquimarina discodermiae TaxID=3231043 RepID=UPI003461DED6